MHCYKLYNYYYSLFMIKSYEYVGMQRGRDLPIDILNKA